MTFKAPGGDRTSTTSPTRSAIVPQHIWSTIADPVKYPDTNPVGTGAYTVKPVHARRTSPTRPTRTTGSRASRRSRPSTTRRSPTQRHGQHLPGHRPGPVGQPVHPEHQEVLPGQEPELPLLVPAGGQRVAVHQPEEPDPEEPRRSARPWPTRSTGSRRPRIGEYGYEPASNQTGIVTPTFSSWLDTSQAAKFGSNYAYNPAKAISILTAAGFKKGSDGIMAKGGQKLSFSIINNGGFSDWVAAVNVLQGNLKAVGIQVTPKNLSAPAYQTGLYNGKYELAYGSETGGPDAVLRAAPVAVLGQHRHRSAAGRLQLRAVQQPADRHADQLVRHHDQHRHAAQHREQAAAGHAAGGAGHPDHRAVDWFQYDTGTSPAGSPRATRTPSRRRTTSPTGASSCCTWQPRSSG